MSCLLLEGLHAEGESSAEAFEEVLAEIDLPDKEWRLGNYQILDEIGRGGMGVIYRAKQRHSRRIVAVKRVLSYDAQSHETLTRFRREAETASSLDHPNILPIYEVSESDEGVPFFSMKLATGGSLRGATPSLTGKPKECVRLIAKVAHALDYAHQRGILHRDLQPGNILLDAHGEPMISDFGLAKWRNENSDLTRTLTTFGTPGYIAPEQAESSADDLTPAADIYSLGAILYNLLAGRPPFVGANALSVIRQAGGIDAPRLRSLAPSLDRDLETVTARCLERDPKSRYQSAGELAEDLERWLDGRPIIARPVSQAARAWRWSRRNPLVAASMAASLILALAVGWLVRSKPASIVDKSIAVLPFENLGGKQEDSFFADGMQDDILAGLAKVAGLKVISRSSVRGYKPGAPRKLNEIAHELGVRHVLEGSVRRAAGRVRISAHLTDASTGAQLWAEQYERELEDVFTIQTEIAQKIAGELRVQLSAKEKALIATTPTNDMAAYDLYLRARELGRDPGSANPLQRQSEVSLLEQAIARDPEFMPALCALARAHLELYWFNQDHTPTRLALASEAVEKAARLQPEAGEVHFARGILHYWGHRDYAAALRELELARHSLPNEAEIVFFSALVERRQGNWIQSTRDLEKALTADPRNTGILFELGRSNYFALKRYPEAAKLCDSVLQWKPHDFAFEQARAKVDLASKGDLRPFRELITGGAATSASADSLAYARLELALAGRDFVGARAVLSDHPLSEFTTTGFVIPREWFEGLVARGLGDEALAQRSFAAARERVSTFIAARPDDVKAQIVQAEIDANLGRDEEAVREGEQAAASCTVERDAVDGPEILSRLAGIHAQVGNKSRALDFLAAAARIPNGPNYGQLALDQRWDPLRAEPRFAEIAQSLAPK